MNNRDDTMHMQYGYNNHYNRTNCICPSPYCNYSPFLVDEFGQIATMPLCGQIGQWAAPSPMFQQASPMSIHSSPMSPQIASPIASPMASPMSSPMSLVSSSAFSSGTNTPWGSLATSSDSLTNIHDATDVTTVHPNHTVEPMTTIDGQLVSSTAELSHSKSDTAIEQLNKFGIQRVSTETAVKGSSSGSMSTTSKYYLPPTFLYLMVSYLYKTSCLLCGTKCYNGRHALFPESTLMYHKRIFGPDSLYVIAPRRKYVEVYNPGSRGFNGCDIVTELFSVDDLNAEQRLQRIAEIQKLDEENFNASREQIMRAQQLTRDLKNMSYQQKKEYVSDGHYTPISYKYKWRTHNADYLIELAFCPLECKYECIRVFKLKSNKVELVPMALNPSLTPTMTPSLTTSVTTSSVTPTHKRMTVYSVLAAALAPH